MHFILSQLFPSVSDACRNNNTIYATYTYTMGCIYIWKDKILRSSSGHFIYRNRSMCIYISPATHQMTMQKCKRVSKRNSKINYCTIGCALGAHHFIYAHYKLYIPAAVHSNPHCCLLFIWGVHSRSNRTFMYHKGLFILIRIYK